MSWIRSLPPVLDREFLRGSLFSSYSYMNPQTLALCLNNNFWWMANWTPSVEADLWIERHSPCSPQAAELFNFMLRGLDDWECIVVSCLHTVVGRPGHKSLPLALDGGFAKPWQLKSHAAEAVVKEAFVLGLAGRGLCAPEHKWVSISGRLWAAHTRRGARPQTPSALGRKGGIVCAGCPPREIFLLFFCLELLLF